MTVKELIDILKEMNQQAEVMVISDNDNIHGYQEVIDCEEEYSDLVTIGCRYEGEDSL